MHLDRLWCSDSMGRLNDELRDQFRNFWAGGAVGGWRSSGVSGAIRVGGGGGSCGGNMDGGGRKVKRRLAGVPDWDCDYVFHCFDPESGSHLDGISVGGRIG